MIENIVLLWGYFILGFVYSSFPEWMVHRYVLHRVFNIFGYKFQYPFNGHTIVHHQTFKGDSTYVLHNHPIEKQTDHQITIPMAWWNGPALIAVASLPFIAMGLIRVPWSSVVSLIAGIAFYYVVYEYIHWCMHKPMNRWFERTYLFKWIDGHHRRHHEKMSKNFNVVLPLADVILGTLYLTPRKQPVKFPPWSNIISR